MSKSIYIAGHKGMVGSSILKKISNEYPEYNIILRTKKELNLLNQSKVCKFFKENHIDIIYFAAAKVGGILANSSYPYEFLLVYFDKYASNFQKNTVNKLVNFKQSLESFGSDVADTFYLLHSKTNIEKAIEDLDRWKNTTKNWFSIIKKNIDKVDIYSFGTVCIELDRYFDKSTLSKDELILYYDFLYKITMVDFRYRPNIYEAIKLYNNILNNKQKKN